MAVSVDSSSPGNLNKEALRLMDSSPLVSPTSDKRFWRNLNSRVDSILEKKGSDMNVGESNGGTQLKEDSLLLLKGFDSIAHTLSQLSSNLDNAIQGARQLAEPPTLTEIFRNKVVEREENKENRSEEEKSEGKKKRKLEDCVSVNLSSDDQTRESPIQDDQGSVDEKLNKTKKMAISMATKAASLARELRSLKSDMCFMKEQYSLLEEENKRLQDGLSKGIRPEEDDLVRLQLEALLTEKSRLANENANLKRENQCLKQLVEYHQLASQELSPVYEEATHGTCLDFSSPRALTAEESNEGNGRTPRTPRTDNFGPSALFDMAW